MHLGRSHLVEEGPSPSRLLLTNCQRAAELVTRFLEFGETILRSEGSSDEFLAGARVVYP